MKILGDSMDTLLFITHINFWERDLGSRMRLYHMLNYLKEYFVITIVYTAKRQKNDLDKLEEIGYHKMIVFLDELHESEVNESQVESFLGEHTVLKNFFDPSLYKKMQTYINEYSVENIIIEYIHLSYFLPLLKGKKTFLDSHDIMNKRNELFKKNGHKHWIDISEKKELSLFVLYDGVIAIQQKEHRYLLDQDISSILAPYSLPMTEGKHRKQMKNIVFVGGNTVANTESINWFLLNVWSLFSGSGLQLKICGAVSECIQEEKKILREKNIILMGKIDDLDSFYRDEADIIINPVHIGGGLKIKNAEALAYGLPLITTYEGSNGLESGVNSAFLLANSADEWIDALIILSLSGSLRECLSKNAYHFSQNYFSEKVCYGGLVDVLSGNEKVNYNIDSSDKKKIQSYDSKKKKKKTEKIICSLQESAGEIKKQMYQHQASILAQELFSYMETINALVTTSVIRHPFGKVSKYKILIKEYEKYKYFIYNESENKNDQKLVYTFREKIGELCAVDIKYHPREKLKAYKKMIELFLEYFPWGYNLTAAPDKD